MIVHDPSTALDHNDPGDDTQLRFRYQHGYGVILLSGAATGKLDYVAIWCEHHEDLLGEKPNGQFDSFQIKTATPESGPWRMSSEKLLHSIGRFMELDIKFPGKFESHSFVSNVRCYDTQKPKEIGKSPVRFFRAVQGCTECDRLSTPFAETLQDLSTKLECEAAVLYETCKRIRIVKGPALESFDTSIAHEHLPQLNGCATLTPAELDGLRDELMQTVFNASSVAIDDPSKHWCCVLGDDHLNPRLKAKRLIVKDTIQDVIAGRAHVFRFAPSDTPLRLGDGEKDLGILAKKLTKGNLANQLETMQSRTLSTEQHLLALVAQDAENAGKVINQLKEVVRGVCSDAEAIALVNPEPWGVDMYRRVVVRLEGIANNQPDMVHRQPYECLMGVAGLLTEECIVWWSPRFDLKEAI